MDKSCVGHTADDVCKHYYNAHQTKACDAETLFTSTEVFNPATGKSLKEIWAETLKRYKSDAYFNDPIYIEDLCEGQSTSSDGCTNPRSPTRFFGSGSGTIDDYAPHIWTQPRLPNAEHGFMNLIRLGLVRANGPPRRLIRC